MLNDDIDRILVTNIQRFCLHDGPGIRTTVFLKGCTLHCPWCCNPENISSIPQKYNKDGEIGEYGRYYTTNSLLDELLKDYYFYSGELQCNEWNVENAEKLELLPGGITFSGGECLLHIWTILEVLHELRSRNVHISVETSLFVPRVNLETAVSLVDLFYVDVKSLDERFVKERQGGNISEFINNFDFLVNWRSETRQKKPLVIRVPIIGGETDNMDNLHLIERFIKKYSSSILKVEVIKGHHLADSKYKSLGLNVPKYKEVSDQIVKDFMVEISKNGLIVDICKI